MILIQTDNELLIPLEETAEVINVSLTKSMNVKFQIPESYPDTLPTVKMESDDDFLKGKIPSLEEETMEWIDTELSSSCLFGIVDKIKDRLIELIQEEIKFNANEEERLKKKKEDEFEKQFIGAAKQTFEEWYASRQKEVRITVEQLKREKEAEIKRKSGRLTGKEYFMRNAKNRNILESAELKDIDKKEDMNEIFEKLSEQGVDFELFTRDELFEGLLENM